MRNYLDWILNLLFTLHLLYETKSEKTHCIFYQAFCFLDLPFRLLKLMLKKIIRIL